MVNVSSPNTPGLRELQEKASLRRILSHLQNINHGRINTKPLLLKITNLTVGQLDDIIDLSQEVKLSSMVATNTTINRNHLITAKEAVEKIGAGGLSGFPLKKKSTQIVNYIRRQTNGSIPIIANEEAFLMGEMLKKNWPPGHHLYKFGAVLYTKARV